MLLDEVLIVELVVEDVADHAQEERGVCAGLDGDPLVCLAGSGGEVGVDHHDAGAGLLGLEEDAGGGEARLAEVGARLDDQLGLGPVAGLGVGHGVAPAHAQRGVEAVAGARVDARVVALSACAEHGGEELDVCLGAVGHHHGAVAVRRLHLLELCGDLVEGLVPADLLEGALSALARAAHGGLHAALAVHMLDLGKALEAAGLVAALRGHVVGLDEHDPAVPHRALERAHASAVRLVVGAGDALLGLCKRSRGLQPLAAGCHSPCSCKRCAGNAGCFEEAAPRNAR